MNFKQANPTRLYFGEGSLSNLASEIKEATNVLITYGKGSVKKQGLYDVVIDELKSAGKNIFELPGIKPNPDISSVYEGIDLCKKEKIDLILAVGGTSVLDCSKIIAIGSKYDGDIWEKIKAKDFSLSKKTTLGSILTNAATSSENNYYAVISNEKEKLKLGTAFWPIACPDFSILDPKYTVTLPKVPTTESITDICSHLIETYFHNMDMNNPIVKIIDSELEAMIRAMVELGPKLMKDLTNLEYRETMMYIATQALSTRLRHVVGGDWACHSMEHAASAIYDISHGGGLAILMPSWMDYCVENHTPKFKQMAVNIFDVTSDGKSDLDVAKEGILAFRAFLKEIGAPSKFADYDIDDREIDQLVAKSLGGAEKIGGMSGLDEAGVYSIFKASM